MNYSRPHPCMKRFSSFTGVFALLASVTVVAQTTTTATTTQKPVVKTATVAPAKPAPKPVVTVAPAKTVIAPASTTAKSTSSPLATTTNSQPVTSAIAPAPAQVAPSNFSSSGASPNVVTPSGSRLPVSAQGVGTFLWPGGWTLIAYGCMRTGTRLFCDFDTTNQNNVQAATSIWSGGGGVNLVDDGGKITPRHNAFFIGSDGTQFSTAYISPQPVRFIIEYDDVDQRYTSVSLVLGGNRIQGVPITTMDPSQPAGTIPARSASGSPAPAAVSATSAQQAATPGATGTLDNATQAINNANNNVNTQKKKAQDFWKSLQSTVQSH